MDKISFNVCVIDTLMCYMLAPYLRYAASLVIQWNGTFFIAAVKWEIIMCIQGTSKIFLKIKLHIK